MNVNVYYTANPNPFISIKTLKRIRNIQNLVVRKSGKYPSIELTIDWETLESKERREINQLNSLRTPISIVVKTDEQEDPWCVYANYEIHFIDINYMKGTAFIIILPEKWQTK